MLTYVKAAVTRNQSEKKINSLLDFVSQSTDMDLLQTFYGATLTSLEEAKNERLWFKTQIKLCGLWFDLKEYARAQRILRTLHRCAPSSILLSTTLTVSLVPPYKSLVMSLAQSAALLLNEVHQDMQTLSMTSFAIAFTRAGRICVPKIFQVIMNDTSGLLWSLMMSDVCMLAATLPSIAKAINRTSLQNL